MESETNGRPTVIVIGPSDQLTGFIIGFWGKHVNGFNPKEHCQDGLIGPRDRRVRRDLKIGVSIELMDRRVKKYPYFYVCGVTPRWQNNFHLVVKWAAGEEARAITYNGFEVTVTDAVELAIPPLPDGFADMPKSYTTCRNWQFGVEYFGLPDDFTPPPPKPKKKRSGKGRKPQNLEPGQREMLLAAFVEKDGDVYVVPSDTSDAIHEVTFHEKGRFSCSCVHGRHRPYSANCYHVKTALAFSKNMILKPLL